MYRISCIAYHVLHIMYCISCIAYHVSHILYRISYMQGHGRPRGTRSHERPREATGGHGKDGRPRAAPHRPPQNIIPTKMGRPRSPERSVKKKTGDGGPRGATGGHGAAQKKSRYNHRPPSISSRTPTSCACLGNIIDCYICMYICIYNSILYDIR